MLLSDTVDFKPKAAKRGQDSHHYKGLNPARRSSTCKCTFTLISTFRYIEHMLTDPKEETDYK